jgi:hypothetical protein
MWRDCSRHVDTRVIALILIMIEGATQLRKYQFSTDGHEPFQEYFEEQYRQEPCQEYHDEQNHADELTMYCGTLSAVISRLFSKARRSEKPVFTTCNEMKVWPVLKFSPCDHCTEHRPYRAKRQHQTAACTDRRRRIVPTAFIASYRTDRWRRVA